MKHYSMLKGKVTNCLPHRPPMYVKGAEYIRLIVYTPIKSIINIVKKFKVHTYCMTIISKLEKLVKSFKNFRVRNKKKLYFNRVNFLPKIIHDE